METKDNEETPLELEEEIKAEEEMEDANHSSNRQKFLDILTLQKFTANGKEYFLEPHMSIERHKVAQKFELEISYSVTFKRMYKGLNELYDLLNNLKLVEASVKLRDTMEGMSRIDDQNNHHAILKYCTLILNTHEEDRDKWDEKIMAEKIEDWQREGIPVTSFFAVVLRSVSGLLEIYRENSLATSQSLTPSQEEE